MTWRLATAALVIGIVGFALAWGGWHLVEDHARLHRVDQQVGAWQQAVIEQQKAAPGAGK